MIFFLIPRFTTGYLSALNLQPSLMTGFSDNVTLGEIGEIKTKHRRGDAHPRRRRSRARAEVHWRGIVLTNFDGQRWFTPAHDQVVLSPNPDGEFRFVGLPLPRGDFYPLRYTVLMEPIATDAIFVAPRAGNSARTLHATNPTAPARLHSMATCLVDHTGSLFNPSHNDTKIRYEGFRRSP